MARKPSSDRALPPLTAGFAARLRRAKRMDRIARWVVRGGGLVIIGSVVLILATLVYQAYPLALPASGGEMLRAATLPPDAGPVLRVWASGGQEILAGLSPDGVLHWSDAGAQMHALPLPELRGAPRVVTNDVHQERVAVWVDAPAVQVYQVALRAPEGASEPELRVRQRDALEWPFGAQAPRDLAYGYADAGEYAIGVLTDGRAVFTGLDEDEEPVSFELTPLLHGRPTNVAVNDSGALAAFAIEGGRVAVLDLEDWAEPKLQEVFVASPAGVTAVGFVLGGQTLAVGDAGGRVSMWLRVPDAESPGGRSWKQLHQIASGSKAPIRELAPSVRSKTFVALAEDGTVGVLHATTARRLLRMEVPGTSTTISMSPRDDGVLVGTTGGGVHLRALENEHPEATLAALFGRIWYEGYPRPRWVWQSTGGTDDFEPKLSLIPLIFGTLKGTVYALIYAVPVAVLAALFTSQFASRRLQAIVKPTVELMAGIPSVVIGFLAALWLAPLLERLLVGWFLFPAFVLAIVPPIVGAWFLVPVGVRARVGATGDFLVACLALLSAGALAVAVSPLLDRVLFDGDFRQWLFTNLGVNYAQRNCIVVGFALGFAVLPIIFTIAEDAFSNVPENLVAASLALGATHWQTAWHIVLPAARAGVFAAILLGVGRAVGETMIVLMATGNTPILDWSPFNGMRTMSATIAVEAPEAPVGGTLYRVLFLTAALLFVMTFLLNTFADFLTERLRHKPGKA